MGALEKVPLQGCGRARSLPGLPSRDFTPLPCTAQRTPERSPHCPAEGAVALMWGDRGEGGYRWEPRHQEA